MICFFFFFFFFQAEDGIRDHCVTGVQTCALPISLRNRDTASCALFLEKPCRTIDATSSGGESLLGYTFRRVRSAISRDRKSTRLNSSHTVISYAVFCLKKKKK